MTRLKKTWQLAEDGQALATELHTVLTVSHRQAKGLIDAGCVKINDEPAHVYGLRLKTGDRVAVDYDPDTVYQTMPQPRKQLDQAGFTILWEDKHLLFVDKPAGLLTVPSEKGHEASLAEAITDNYRRRGFKRFQLYIVHRLDRFSSGVLVFAMTPEALHGLKKLFESHNLHRIYKAILVGEIPENAGTLTGKLVEHSKSLKMSVVHPRKEEPKGAKHAITHFRVLERLPGHTVVEVKLETGRRNQIRVQFADRGFPLLGDQVYGTASELIDRQALHAELLGFRHPVTEESLTVIAPMPSDMELALKKLRNVRRVERAEAGIQGEEGIYKPRITKGRKFERVLRAERFAPKAERSASGPERSAPKTERSASGTGRFAPDDRKRSEKTVTTDEKQTVRPSRDASSKHPDRQGRPDRTGRPAAPHGSRSASSGPRSASSGSRSASSSPRSAGSGPSSAGSAARGAGPGGRDGERRPNGLKPRSSSSRPEAAPKRRGTPIRPKKSK